MMFFTTEMCGKHAYHVTPKKKIEIDLENLKNMLKDFEVKYCDSLILILKYKDKSITVFSNGRMTIKNVESERDAIKIASSILDSYGK